MAPDTHPLPETRHGTEHCLSGTLRDMVSVRGIGIGLICASVLSGKISLDRLVPSMEFAYWLEFRWIFFAGALGLLLAARSQFEIRWGLNKTIFLSLFATYIAFLLFRNAPFAIDGSGAKFADVVMLFSQCALATLAIGDSHSRRMFFGWIVVCGLVLFLLALAGLSDQDVNGHGWAPLSGPITFSRIEFLAFCAAIVLVGGSARWSIPIALIAAAFAFGTLASLQKIVLLAFALAALFVMSGSMICGYWRQAAVSGAAVVLGVGIWVLVFGSIFSARLDESYSVDQARVDGGGAGPTVEAPYMGLGNTYVTLNFCIVETNRDRATKSEGDTVCEYLQYVDRTARLTFFITSFAQFLEAPLYGNGLASYRIFLVDPYSKELVEYLYPHNLPLEVLQESGIIGFTIVFLMLLSLLYFVITSTTDGREKVPVISFLLFILLTAMFSGDFYDSRLFWIVALLATDRAASKTFGVTT